MNFMNLKKLLVLSSVLMAFGNTSYASDIKHSIDYNSGIYNNIHQNDNINRMILNIIMGIENNVNDNKLNDELLKKVSTNEVAKELAKHSNNCVLTLIEQQTHKIMNELVGEDVSNDDNVNNSFTLITILDFIKQVESIKNELKIGDVISNNASYDLFKKIASEIGNNGMNRLKDFIKNEYKKRKNENKLNIGFFTSTIEKISNVSKYKIEKGDLVVLNSILENNAGRFVESSNHKIRYCNTAEEEKNYNIEKRQFPANKALEDIMDIVNTEFTMTNSEYSMLSYFADGIAQDKLDKIKNNPEFITDVIDSQEKFAKLVSKIVNNDIFNQQALVKKENDNNETVVKRDLSNINNNNNNNPLLNNNDKVNMNNQQLGDDNLNNQQNNNNLHNNNVNNNNMNNNNKNNLPGNDNNNNPQLNNNDVDVNKYNIPGISDKLPKGLYIKSIKVEPKAPEGAEKIGLRDINKLINGGAKVLAVNCNHKANGIIFSDQIFQANGIIKMICNSGEPIGFQIKSELAKKLLGGKTINDFIVIEVDNKN